MKEEENICSVRRLNVWGLLRHLATFMLTLCSQHVSNITELTLVRVLISNLVFVSVLTNAATTFILSGWSLFTQSLLFAGSPFTLYSSIFTFTNNTLEDSVRT